MAEKKRELVKFSLIASKTDFVFTADPINCSTDLAKMLKQIHATEGNDFQEFFYCLFLSRANRITGYYLASMGGMTGTVADPRLIVKAAALANCCNVVLSHNHPSGNLKPSRADEQLTTKIREALKWFDINVLDHIIISDDGHYSFADEGILM